MKLTAAIYICMTALSGLGQTRQDTLKVIATLVSKGEGSKIHFATYKVIKVLNGKINNDTLIAGYYFYKENKHESDTSLLTLLNYPGETTIPNYFIFPEYDAVKGIENVSLSAVGFEYWENCETGKDCIPFTVRRKEKSEKSFLLMPCGGTFTSVTLSDGSSELQKAEIVSGDCPPVFDLTGLPDGKYTASMIACGLGGKIEFKLASEF